MRQPVANLTAKRLLQVFWVPVFLLAATAHGQLTTPINYFHCPPPPADVPEIFAPGIVSQPVTWEEKITFAPDGTEVFFGRHPDGGDHYFSPKVMHVRYENHQWTPPEVASFSRGKRMGWPRLSPNGRKLFLEEFEGKVVFSTKAKHFWSDVELLETHVKAQQGFGLGQETKSGTLYFHDRYERVAYAMRNVNGHYSKPEPLSYKINPCVEFFVSPNDDYILFQPLNWRNPLHISFRQSDGQWDMPLPLQIFFEQGKWDCKGIGPSISPDGKYLFFGKAGDIYWVRADFLETLRNHKRAH